MCLIETYNYRMKKLKLNKNMYVIMNQHVITLAVGKSFLILCNSLSLSTVKVSTPIAAA